MNKTISVALATYNGEKYLQELLESLAKQTYLPFELIISDDNSSDKTIAIIEKFSKTAPFNVIVIKNKLQLGVIKNFAKAFGNTNGELIAYCDQDDIWHKEKLAKCVTHFSNPSVKLSMHRSEVVNDKLQPLGYCIPEKNEIEIGETVFPSSTDMTYGLGHQMLFDRASYQNFEWIFNNEYVSLQTIAENYDILIRFIAGMNGSIVNIEDTLVKFRRHDTATSDAGLTDKSSEAVSGFLGKKPDDYARQANEFTNIADTIEVHVIPKMKKYKVKLTKYCCFLKKRAHLIDLRSTIYSSDSLFQRCKAYIKLIFKKAYILKSRGGFGKKALLVDIFVSCFGLKGAQKIIAIKSLIGKKNSYS
ncbi:MAG: glycosyltransferase involved in cell wall biosynthesis [Cellvibrionaceae bacterium]|jgi:glycosyltransferase involved in cell wall biosynthesis